MSFQEAVKLQDLETFAFPALYEGVPVKITVAKENSQFLVLIDDVPAAKVAPHEDSNTCHVTTGYLNDEDLIQEIGDRIKARYKNFSS